MSRKKKTIPKVNLNLKNHQFSKWHVSFQLGVSWCIMHILGLLFLNYSEIIPTNTSWSNSTHESWNSLPSEKCPKWNLRPKWNDPLAFAKFRIFPSWFGLPGFQSPLELFHFSVRESICHCHPGWALDLRDTWICLFDGKNQRQF